MHFTMFQTKNLCVPTNCTIRAHFVLSLLIWCWKCEADDLFSFMFGVAVCVVGGSVCVLLMYAPGSTTNE